MKTGTNKQWFKKLCSLLMAACMIISLGATVGVSAAESADDTNEGRRSQVFDLITPDKIPSDGKIGRIAGDDAALMDADPESAVSETETYIPLVMIVMGFQGQAYNATYDWSSTIFEGEQSLRQYYEDMSFGKFTFLPVQETSAYGIDGNTSKADRADDGVIHVTLSTAKQKGWAISADRTADLENMNAFSSALSLAAKYMDFSAYDSNGDGVIQNEELAVGFVVAGRDAANHSASYTTSNKKYYIWPHAYSFSECRESYKRNLAGFPDIPVVDGTKVDSYIAIADSYETNGKYDSTGNNLLQEYYGTLAHELGHYLGLPDLYDTSSGGGAWAGYDVSYLSLMNLGGYGKDLNGQYRPYSLDIWSRVTLGWVEPVTVTPTSSKAEFDIAGSMDADAEAPIALRVNTGREGEYYLIENRRFTGWDAGMSNKYPAFATAGGGLILWHIDDDINNEFMKYNSISNSYHRPGVVSLFWEGSADERNLIGSKVLSDRPFFCKDTWGVDLAFPLYDRTDLYHDTPADRTLSGIVLTFESDSASIIRVSLCDYSGIYSPPGGAGNDPTEPEPLSFEDCRALRLAFIDMLAEDGDSEAALQLIADAKEAIGSLSYDPALSLAENKAVLDPITEQLIMDLAAQRTRDDAVSEPCQKDETCPMAPFTDTDLQAWYHEGVHWALETTVMNGTGADVFAPMSDTTRAMVVSMLWRMAGSPKAADAASFKDVPDDTWYTDAIYWAAENGIVNGYSADRFGPNDPVTREQFVTILWRCAKFHGADVGSTAGLNTFADAGDVAAWAFEAFCWAVECGIIRGVTETTLSPATNANRAQAATMLMRFESTLPSP